MHGISSSIVYGGTVYQGLLYNEGWTSSTDYFIYVFCSDGSVFDSAMY